jgi:hypothetical protein
MNASSRQPGRRATRRTEIDSTSWRQVSPWTGWITADLFAYLGRSSATTPIVADLALITVELAVRRDIVTVWVNSRTLAVIDRDRLRAWLGAPGEPLIVDDVEFLIIDRHLCVRIDGYGPYVLAPDPVRRLVEQL